MLRVSRISEAVFCAFNDAIGEVKRQGTALSWTAFIDKWPLPPSQDWLNEEYPGGPHEEWESDGVRGALSLQIEARAEERVELRFPGLPTLFQQRGEFTARARGYANNDADLQLVAYLAELIGAARRFRHPELYPFGGLFTDRHEAALTTQETQNFAALASSQHVLKRYIMAEATTAPEVARDIEQLLHLLRKAQGTEYLLYCRELG